MSEYVSDCCGAELIPHPQEYVCSNCGLSCIPIKSGEVVQKSTQSSYPKGENRE